MVDYFEDTEEKIARANLERKLKEKAVKEGKELKQIPKKKSTTTKKQATKSPKKTAKKSSSKSNRTVGNITTTPKKKVKKNYFGFAVYLTIVFGVLFIICYRYAWINTQFSKKEKLKNDLMGINKEISQLEVTIEKQLNINNVEKMATEMLGMKKLDNSQKVYIVLEKKDYTQSNSNTIEYEDKNWIGKLLETLGLSD